MIIQYVFIKLIRYWLVNFQFTLLLMQFKLNYDVCISRETLLVFIENLHRKAQSIIRSRMRSTKNVWGILNTPLIKLSVVPWYIFNITYSHSTHTPTAFPKRPKIRGFPLAPNTKYKFTSGSL